MASIRLSSSSGSLRGTVRIPPSKSYTHRALLLASLSDGVSKIRDPLLSRDTLATIHACRAIGANLEEKDSSIVVEGGRPKVPDDVIDVENSGTTLRFMTSVLSVAPKGFSVLTGDSSLRHRPMKPLMDALKELGVNLWATKGNGCAPLIIEGGGFKGGEVEMDGGISSQFVSSILITAPLASGDTTLRVTNPVSTPYVDATIRLSELFGAEIRAEGNSSFKVRGRQEYCPSDFTVPSDFSSASFLMAAVALVGGRVEMEGLNSGFPQGDSAIIGIMRSMGVQVSVGPRSLIVRGDGGGVKGGTFSLANTPDLLPVLAVLALASDKPVELREVGHARYKETDRIRVLAEELAKVGARIEEHDDGLNISKPSRLSHASLDAHGDHRIFMAFSLASLFSEGSISIEGEESVDVSYPGFLQDLVSIGAEVQRD